MLRQGLPWVDAPPVDATYIKARPTASSLNKSDCTGAAVLLRELPGGTAWMGDKGYGSDKIRILLREQGMPPCTRPGGTATRESMTTMRVYNMGRKVENPLPG